MSTFLLDPYLVLDIPPVPPGPGQIAYTTPGTYTFIAPT